MRRATRSGRKHKVLRGGAGRGTGLSGVGSLSSIGRVGSILSVLSIGSAGSAGSILSVGSAVLSIGGCKKDEADES